jgi:hypothetical protein
MQRSSSKAPLQNLARDSFPRIRLGSSNRTSILLQFLAVLENSDTENRAYTRWGAVSPYVSVTTLRRRMDSIRVHG